MTEWKKKKIGKRTHYYIAPKKTYVAYRGVQSFYGKYPPRKFQGIRLIKDRNDLDTLSPDLTDIQWIHATDIKKAREEAKRIGVLD